MNLQVVLEKVREQEVELRTLRERLKGYNAKALNQDNKALNRDTRDNEYNDARGFIYRVWPTLDISSLEENMPKAQNAFKKCKSVGDRNSLQKMLLGTLGHADRLKKKLDGLRPDLVIDDEKEAQQFKKVSEQIASLGKEIQEYLKVHADDK